MRGDRALKLCGLHTTSIWMMRQQPSAGERTQMHVRPLRALTRCVNTVYRFTVVTQRSASAPFICSVHCWICRSSLSRPVVFTCPILALMSLFIFAVGPVPGEPFSASTNGHDKDLVRLSQPHVIQRFLRARLLAGGFATQFLFAECKA